MRLGTFVFDGQARIGCVVGEEVLDLERAYVRYLSEVQRDPHAEALARFRISNDMLLFLRGGERSWEAAARAVEHFEKRREEGALQGEARPLRDVRLKAPLRPEAVVCAGSGPSDPQDADLYRHLEFFVKSGPHVAGPGDPIPYEPEMDLRCEVELGVIIGRRGKDVPLEEVMDYIFGFTVFTDLLAADRLGVSLEGWMFHARAVEGGSLEAAGVLGPWILTKDEMGDLEGLPHRLWVNGELQEEFCPRDLPTDPLSFVSYLSTFFTLDPGIVIACGSPGGPRLGRSASGEPTLLVPPMRCGSLRPRHRVRTEIERIGSLENPVRSLAPEA